MIHHYIVFTEEYEYTDPILEDGTGPRCTGCDSVYVSATSKREAKIAAIRTPEFEQYVRDCRLDKRNPFSRLTVEDLKCKHGHCFCEECDPDNDGCEQCANEGVDNV